MVSRNVWPELITVGTVTRLVMSDMCSFCSEVTRRWYVCSRFGPIKGKSL